MTDRFSNALLAALNESAEFTESDWNSIEAVLRPRMEPATIQETVHAAASDNRFAAAISSGMAKARGGR